MTVPLLDVHAHHEPIEAELLQALARVVRSQTFILGPEVHALEARLAAYCGAKHAIGVSSGTDALRVALMALDIARGHEVITSAYSFFASAGVVARLGARPVFVDIEPTTFNIDAGRIEDAVTPNTRAIMPVHLYGQCADMTPILGVAARRGLAVVEDAAQAIGAEDAEGRRAGSMCTMGTLSFYPTKNLGALGDAGMVVTSDDALADLLRTLRNHGASPKYNHRLIGGNFRLDAVQAATLGVKLNSLDGWTKRRQENARRYATLFDQVGLTGRGVVIVPAGFGESRSLRGRHIVNQYVIRVPRRDALKA